LSPHIAASPQQAVRRMGQDAARGILDILGGADALSPPAGAPWQPVNRVSHTRENGKEEPQVWMLQIIDTCRYL
jgi:hypothetical protein